MSAPKHEMKKPTLGYETAQGDIRQGYSYRASAYGVPDPRAVECTEVAQNPFGSMGLNNRRATPLGSHDGLREEASFFDEPGFAYRPRFQGV